uniref:Ig-like domain-containing protein n=1 Tax=Poecilia latipinna TaxID=48699 RepID=A0A3B3UEN7_9TELE
WLNPGASVTLSCEVKPSSAGWRFYWYKAVPDFSTNYYRYDPLPGSISGTVENSFRIDGQKHTAGFTCRAGKGNPEYLTDYSEPKFVWTSDPHPAASLSVSPDREQHFTSESVTLNCGGNSAEWRVKRFRDGFINCSDSWEMTGSSCTINSNLSFKSVFWCESGSGEFSDAVNISVHGLLLVSPVHPVTEGASVTLSCRLRGETKLSDVIFYHNDKLIQNDSRGELKISAVSQSDEGFYKCEHSGEVSPQSWMAVKGGVFNALILLNDYFAFVCFVYYHCHK